MQRAISFAAITGGLALLGATIYSFSTYRRPVHAGERINGVHTVEDAIAYLQQTGLTGWALVAEAQHLVNRRMAYSRRNSWDSPAAAFARGMGYCDQQALALKAILDGLGIQSRAVAAARCRFPASLIHEYKEPARISGHVWLRVSIDGVTEDVCPGDPDNAPGRVHFEIMSHVFPYGGATRFFGRIGSAMVNVHRDNAALRRLGRRHRMRQQLHHRGHRHELADIAAR